MYLNKHRRDWIRSVFVALIILFGITSSSAQTTSFTYQGKLSNNSTPATGNYDFEFRLYDAASGGSQQGTTQALTNVAVMAGIFTVGLDFGACPTCFNGAPRFLDLSVRPTGGGAFTPLSPRQQITSTPYAVKSLNAAAADGLSVACINCVTSSQIASVYGSAVTGTIPVSSVPAGSTNYIQNGTSQQSTSNFNISGTGTADIFNAATQYSIGSNRALFVSGVSNSNTFVGVLAGNANPSGSLNSFFGEASGRFATTGDNNSFYGAASGEFNQASDNAFFGVFTGGNNTVGNSNSFFGRLAGQSNTEGSSNAFVGFQAGALNSMGSNNTFLGTIAGVNNTTGSRNTIVGDHATVATGTLNNATAFGANAQVNQSNSLVLGSINGVNGASADTNVGIGTTTPSQRLHVVGNALVTGNLTLNGTFSGSIAASSITGIVATSNGGTGLSSSGTVGSYLRSNGTAWTSSALQVADIPDLSVSYIKNSAGQQTPANFNISGNGTAAGRLTGNIVNAIDHYEIAGFKVLTADLASSNTFVGFTGQGGSNNSFLGQNAGRDNTGTDNSFFGTNAGASSMQSGSQNAFFGTQAGTSNTSGTSNSFFGYAAGVNNLNGGGNSFFGNSSGLVNTSGQLNAFFGSAAGDHNSTGDNNTFVGTGAGNTNTTGGSNTMLGYLADVGSNNLTNATAVGARALVTQSNSLVLGSTNGINGANADTKVGIGTTAPTFKLTVSDPSNTGLRVATATTGGTVASFGGSGAFEIDSPGFAGGRFRVAENGLVTVGRESAGGDLTVFGNTLLNVVTVANGITLNVLGAAGSTPLCRNASAQISTCSSSVRYKQNIHAFAWGLALINRLRPVTFTWRANNELDLGLVAEEVAKVEPLLVTRNDKGEIEGVKYDRVAVVLLNAVQEQQRLIQQQQYQIEALTKLVCSTHRKAKGCQ
jgi:hypothetical protein